jgi:hypothetical protein
MFPRTCGITRALPQNARRVQLVDPVLVATSRGPKRLVGIEGAAGLGVPVGQATRGLRDRISSPGSAANDGAHAVYVGVAALYAYGTAPIEASSGDVVRHRLVTGGIASSIMQCRHGHLPDHSSDRPAPCAQ